MSFIIPTILSSDIEEVQEKACQLKGLTDWLHLDIMDGLFVPEKTVSLDQLKKINSLKEFKLGLHLMVENPVQFLGGAEELGTKRVLVHVEAVVDQFALLQEIKSRGMEAGLVLDLKSGKEKIQPAAWPLMKVVLVMMVRAGQGGQELQKRRLTVVENLKDWRQKKGFNFKIGVDGGVNQQTISACFQAGADILAVGSAIWKASNPGRAIEELNNLVKKRRQD